MSQDNVEIVRRAFEATARGDGASVLALHDPKVELDPSRSALGRLVGAGVYHGHERVRRFFHAYYEAWDHIDYDIEELIDAGDQVVSLVNSRGRGRVSGVEVELRIPGVWTIQEGKIVRVVFFSSRDEALEAVGL